MDIYSACLTLLYAVSPMEQKYLCVSVHSLMKKVKSLKAVFLCLLAEDCNNNLAED